MREYRSGSEFGIAPPVYPEELTLVDFDRVSRYDLLLAAIPTVFVVASLLGTLTYAPTWVALAAGSLLVVPIVVYALAVDPPA